MPFWGPTCGLNGYIAPAFLGPPTRGRNQKWLVATNFFSLQMCVIFFLRPLISFHCKCVLSFFCGKCEHQTVVPSCKYKKKSERHVIFFVVKATTRFFFIRVFTAKKNLHNGKIFFTRIYLKKKKLHDVQRTLISLTRIQLNKKFSEASLEVGHVGTGDPGPMASLMPQCNQCRGK